MGFKIVWTEKASEDIEAIVRYISYPDGEKCPHCPFWADKDRWANDTSVLISLSAGEQFHLLREFYGEVYVPPEVWNEATARPGHFGARECLQAGKTGWLLLRTPSASSLDRVRAMPFTLQSGELDALETGRRAILNNYANENCLQFPPYGTENRFGRHYPREILSHATRKFIRFGGFRRRLHNESRNRWTSS